MFDKDHPLNAAVKQLNKQQETYIKDFIFNEVREKGFFNANDWTLEVRDLKIKDNSSKTYTLYQEIRLAKRKKD